MKHPKLKMLVHWLVCTLFSFLIIYLFVFFGGWRLLQSGDPILLEIVAALALGFVLWLIYEMNKDHEAKIAQMEKRIAALEEAVAKSSFQNSLFPNDKL